MPYRRRQLESAPSHLHHRLARRRSAAHDQGDPHYPFTPDDTRCGGQATGWGEDQRHHSGGGKIQERRGTVRFVEHSTQRPRHWLEVRQQAHRALLRECGEQAIVSELDGLGRTKSLSSAWLVRSMNSMLLRDLYTLLTFHPLTTCRT